MLKFFLFSFFTLFSCQLASKSYGEITVSRVNSVYDGDTFRVDIDHWPEIIGKNTSIRVNQVDTPEIRGKCKKEKQLAQQAKIFTLTKLANAKVITLKNIKRGKYFRVVADVFIDGNNLAAQLLSAGLAKSYTGKKKQSWCQSE